MTLEMAPENVQKEKEQQIRKCLTKMVWFIVILTNVTAATEGDI